MATPSTARLAAFPMAVYFAVFLGPVDAALVAFFFVIRQRDVFAAVLESAALGHTIKASIASIASLASIACVAASIFALLFTRPVKRGPRVAQLWHGPEKVLLFPCRISHSREFPQKHAFSHSYLAVGVPVGFEGNAGGMVSVEAGNKGKQGPFSWRFLDSPGGWFTVDPEDHLERGQPELGLREKLDGYLRAQVSRRLRSGYWPDVDLVRGLTRQPIRTPTW